MTLDEIKKRYPNFEEYTDKWLEDDEELVVFTEWDFSTKETVSFCRSLNGDTTLLYFAGRFGEVKGSGCVATNANLPDWVCDVVKGISEKIG